MELVLQNVGIINHSMIKLDGLTVVCGSNNSGKSTAGKALYASIESLSNLEDKLHDELVTNYRRIALNVSRILDLDSLARYVDFEKMQADLNQDFSVLLIGSSYQLRFILDSSNAIDSYTNLKKAVESLSKELLLDYLKKNRNSTPGRIEAYLNNFQENKEKALAYLADFNKYYDEEDIHDFAEKSVASLFDTEFNGQVFPVNLKSKDKTSFISLSKNGETGFAFSITEKNNLIANVKK